MYVYKNVLPLSAKYKRDTKKLITTKNNIQLYFHSQLMSTRAENTKKSYH